MKMRLITLAISLAGGLTLGLYRASADLEVSAGISIHAVADFYEPLTPNGAWVEVGSYGRCWRPAGVAMGWRPYCDGYWEWTDCGWYWVSDEPWAWACYHYGSWVYDPNYGWVWVPGVEWAPAWVYWRIGGDYIGWVPCGPPGFIIEPAFYVFVESRHFNERVRSGTVIVNNTTIINSTTEIKNARRENRQFDGKSQPVIVNEGPGVDVVQKATGQKFTAVSVREADRRTSVSIPEQIKHGTTNPQKPSTVQQQTIPAPGHNLTPGENPEKPHTVPPNNKTPPQQATPPDRTTPQSPPEKITPPPNNASPSDRTKRPPKESNPPKQSQTAPPDSGNSSEKDQGGNNNGNDKDHGHDNP